MVQREVLDKRGLSIVAWGKNGIVWELEPPKVHKGLRSWSLSLVLRKHLTHPSYKLIQSQGHKVLSMGLGKQLQGHSHTLWPGSSPSSCVALRAPHTDSRREPEIGRTGNKLSYLDDRLATTCMLQRMALQNGAGTLGSDFGFGLAEEGWTLSWSCREDRLWDRESTILSDWPASK